MLFIIIRSIVKLLQNPKHTTPFLGVFLSLIVAALLFFTPKKPFLKDLIPSGFVDIHSHLIPGIDDGAATASEATQLITTLQSLGFAQFIATPHIMEHLWNNTKETIANGLEKLTNELTISNKQVTIRTAAEYLMDGHFSELLQQEPLLCLKDNYVLVEMSYLNPPLQLMDIIFDCQVAGYQPILAHPERYLFYHSQMDNYHKLKKAGCLFQMNLLSVTGYYGTSVATVAEKLLLQGLVDFVGSDVHNQNHIKAFENRVVIKEVATLKEVMANNKQFRH